MIMEETLLQKNHFSKDWEFLNIDLNLTSCVLDSQNGKRTSCVCVCVRESHNPFSLQPQWMRMAQKDRGLNKNVFLMHVLVVQW